ncbi:hypothetical protein [Nocardia jejuensis]|uniref:hypothetical protein n=1 Tax=Nocardia jejuensis TaxID=328049 RepID=UPI000A8638BA|nr:hypothetical protein [Nocardia jejuensis]
MAMDIDVYIADWDRVQEEIAQRGRAWNADLWDSFADEDSDEREPFHLRWPLTPDSWYARCVFRGRASGGLYKDHFGLVDLWQHVRERPDAAPDLIGHVSGLIIRLLGDFDYDEDLTASSGLPAVGTQTIAMACSPGEVTELLDRGRVCITRLEELRPAVEAEMLGYSYRQKGFDEWAALLEDWVNVLKEAQRRGWGLFYSTS